MSFLFCVFYFFGISKQWQHCKKKTKGLGDAFTSVSDPTLVPSLEKEVKSIACKVNHSLFLTNKGKVYACGANYNGHLGLIDDMDHVYCKFKK